jgi:hypothetical protein
VFADALRAHPNAVVAIANYEEYHSGEAFRRVPDGVLGSGPEAAVRLFRHVSFVSGVVLRRAEAQAESTDVWDGSEFYQMYLAARLIAAGGECIGIPGLLIRKDITIAGESVDSYRRARLNPCPIVERKLNLVWIPRLVSAAIAPYCTPREHARLNTRIALQLLGYTYPYWLFEYRRVQSWKYAAGIALGTRPRNVTGGVPLGVLGEVKVRSVYALATLGGLSIPGGWFARIRRRLFALAKRS